jgi:2-polyprenyl-3-methyl-5-hydroxy-6-metoxy-1,4-benzoquinol methylase
MSSVDPAIYNADYYRSSNYADYLERADRYKKTAYELSDLLRKLKLADNNSCILDYGCAVGFLIDGFNEAGHTKVVGFEVSEWAAREARSRNKTVWTDLSEVAKQSNETGIDVMVALDVFEHMTDEQIHQALGHVNPKAIVARIPVSTDGGKSFHLAVSRADKTHINCKTTEQWIKFFQEWGYKTFLRLNLFTVYDTLGVTCLLIL